MTGRMRARPPNRPAGATTSSQPRNQAIVAARDSATGRPIPRLASHAKPLSSAIGARTAAYDAT